MSAAVRVAICEDSRAYTEGLRQFLEADGRLEVVARAADAEGLLGELRQARPDLVTMDLELPGIGGVEAIRRIMATAPVPIVVLSGHVGLSARLVAEALDAGALDAIAKSDVRLDLSEEPNAVALRRRLVDLARGRTAKLTRRAPSAPSKAPLQPSRRPASAAVIALAASAGGPRSMTDVLGTLPASFPVPVLVVQHMSAGFTPGLAAWLDDSIPPPVRLAIDGAPLAAGVTIAPEGAHLTLERNGRLRLDRRTDAGAHRPSANVLLSSVARAEGAHALAVVLTGMGDDGAAGVAAVRAAGGTAFAERPDDATLWSMPAAAVRAGATQLSRDQLAQLLAGLSLWSEA